MERRHRYFATANYTSESLLDEPFDVSVFTTEPGDRAFTSGSVLLFERCPLKTGHQTLTAVVDK